MTSDLFDVQPTRQAEKDILRLRGGTAKATNALRALKSDPYCGHALSGTLAGAHSLAFSMPGGAYRAAYVVLEEERVCLVFLVGPHEGFYEKARRRYKALQRQGTL